MILKFQSETLSELQSLASSDKHSILIDGPSGCGKSYLAKQYANMLGISDFSIVQPTVQSIRDIIDTCYNLSNPVVFCIENLDSGVQGASFTLLKFLEEPASNVYIVVTCQNRYRVPDTIISRSACLSMSCPIESDVSEYAELTDAHKYFQMKELSLWRAVRTLKDVDNVFRFTEDNLSYFEELQELCNFKDTVANIAWKLGHYNNNSETDIPFVINFVMNVSNSQRIRKYGIECVKDLNKSRIASHAVLAKFAFECKYGD